MDLWDILYIVCGVITWVISIPVMYVLDDKNDFSLRDEDFLVTVAVGFLCGLAWPAFAFIGITYLPMKLIHYAGMRTRRNLTRGNGR